MAKGRDLRAWRIARNLTQAQLAEYLHVTPNTIARWERDEMKFHSEHMLRLALQHYDCSKEKF